MKTPMTLLLSLLFSCYSSPTNLLEPVMGVLQTDSQRAKKSVEPTSAPIINQAASLQTENNPSTKDAAPTTQETSNSSSKAWCTGQGTGTKLRWNIIDRENFHRNSFDWDAYIKLWEKVYKGISLDKKMIEITNIKDAKVLFPGVSRASLSKLDFEKNRYLLYFTTPQVVGESPVIQAVVSDSKQISVVVAENYSCGGAWVQPIMLVSLLELERVELPVFIEMCPREKNACPSEPMP